MEFIIRSALACDGASVGHWESAHWRRRLYEEAGRRNLITLSNPAATLRLRYYPYPFP
jgi:hypothetical protein